MFVPNFFTAYIKSDVLNETVSGRQSIISSVQVNTVLASLQISFTCLCIRSIGSNRRVLVKGYPSFVSAKNMTRNLCPMLFHKNIISFIFIWLNELRSTLLLCGFHCLLVYFLDLKQYSALAKKSLDTS